MDSLNHSLPPPFHTRDFNLHQFHQQTSEDEQSGTSGLNMSGLKRERDDNNINNNNNENPNDGESKDGLGITGIKLISSKSLSC